MVSGKFRALIAIAFSAGLLLALPAPVTADAHQNAPERQKEIGMPGKVPPGK